MAKTEIRGGKLTGKVRHRDVSGDGYVKVLQVEIADSTGFSWRDIKPEDLTELATTGITSVDNDCVFDYYSV